MKTDKEFVLMGLKQYINTTIYNIKDIISVQGSLNTCEDINNIIKLLEELRSLYIKQKELEKD